MSSDRCRAGWILVCSLARGRTVSHDVNSRRRQAVMPGSGGEISGLAGRYCDAPKLVMYVSWLIQWSCHVFTAHRQLAGCLRVTGKRGCFDNLGGIYLFRHTTRLDAIRNLGD